MNALYIIYFFVIGMIAASFYGVVGNRLCKNESIIKPRSHCDSCGHTLKWYELIPVLSYIIQKGKCKKCGCKLSVMYPLIGGLLFSLCFFKFGFSREFLISLLIVSFFIIVLVSDINYLIIPDEVTLVFSVLVILIKLFMFSFEQFVFSIMSGILLFCLMYLIMILGNKYFKKETLGGADIKLMFFVGLVLSPSLGLFNIFLSSVIALPISIFFLIKNKDNVIAFGPFILASLFIIYCFI